MSNFSLSNLSPGFSDTERILLAKWLQATLDQTIMSAETYADLTPQVEDSARTLIAKLLDATVTGRQFYNAIDLAEGFETPDPDLRVWFNGSRWTCNVSALDYDVERELTYYLSPSGNDANDGLTPASPKKSIANLLDDLSGAPPAGGAKLVLAPGLYSATDSLNTRNVNAYSFSIVCEDGFAYIPSGRGGTEFSLLGGAVYKRAGHSTIQTVVTWKFRDKYGAPLEFENNATGWASEAAVQAGLGKGEWTIYASNCYIRMPDDSAPDERTMTSTSGSTSLPTINITNQSVFWRGLRGTCHGKGIVWNCNGSAGNTFAAYECEFAGGNNVLYDVFGMVVDSGEIVLERCRADHGVKDGFNYHQGGSPDGGYVIEINCAATGNGSDASSNGSTCHEEVIVVRVGGVYAGNYGRNLHDIHDVQSLNVGCSAGVSQDTTAGTDVAFNAGQGGLSAYATLMWLVDCMSLGGGANVIDYYAAELSTVYLIGTSGAERGAVLYRDDGGQFVRL